MRARSRAEGLDLGGARPGGGRPHRRRVPRPAAGRRRGGRPHGQQRRAPRGRRPAHGSRRAPPPRRRRRQPGRPPRGAALAAGHLRGRPGPAGRGAPPARGRGPPRRAGLGDPALSAVHGVLARARRFLLPLRGEPNATIGRPSPFLRQFRRATGSLVEQRGLMLVPGPDEPAAGVHRRRGCRGGLRGGDRPAGPGRADPRRRRPRGAHLGRRRRHLLAGCSARKVRAVSAPVAVFAVASALLRPRGRGAVTDHGAQPLPRQPPTHRGRRVAVSSTPRP